MPHPDEHTSADTEVDILTEGSERNPEAAPARSVRRATARRASIIDFLAQHPGSTAGDLAKGLSLDPGNVATRLTQLAKAGEINKATHGYRTNEAGATHDEG